MQACFEQVKLQVAETRTCTRYLLHSTERCYRHAVLQEYCRPIPQKRTENWDRYSVCVDPPQHVGSSDRTKMRNVLGEGRRPS